LTPSGSFCNAKMCWLRYGYTVALLLVRPICNSPFFIVFLGVHAFAAKRRLRFEGQKKSCTCGIQSLGAFITRPPHIKKNDRCFWRISGYESIPGMIPKSNARKCCLYDSASFFWFGWHRYRFKTGRSVLRNRLSDMNGFGTVRRATTVHKFLFLLAGCTGLLGFGLKAHFILKLTFVNHKSH